MPKDYAKRVLTTSRKPKPKRRRIEFFILPFVLVSVIGYIWFTHFENKKVSHENWLTRIKTFGHRNKIIKTHTASANNIATQPESDIHFDFYTQLPNQKILLPTDYKDANTSPLATARANHNKKVDQSLIDEALVSAQGMKTKVMINSSLSQDSRTVSSSQKAFPSKTPEQAQYVLSFGQFKSAAEAGQLRISLLLADCEAEIVELHSKRGKIFRVQKGPFMNPSLAKQTQQQFFKKGVTSELQKV